MGLAAKPKSVWSGQDMLHSNIQTESWCKHTWNGTKIFSIFYLLTLLFYKRILVHKDNDVLGWNEISLTPYFLQCAGWNWFFFGGLGIGKWICHFLFTSTRVLIILQHAWTKWKVTKTEIKFPINFTQPLCLWAEVKRAILSERFLN